MSKDSQEDRGLLTKLCNSPDVLIVMHEDVSEFCQVLLRLGKIYFLSLALLSLSIIDRLLRCFDFTYLN